MTTTAPTVEGHTMSIAPAEMLPLFDLPTTEHSDSTVDAGDASGVRVAPVWGALAAQVRRLPVAQVAPEDDPAAGWELVRAGVVLDRLVGGASPVEAFEEADAHVEWVKGWVRPGRAVSVMTWMSSGGIPRSCPARIVSVQGVRVTVRIDGAHEMLFDACTLTKAGRGLTCWTYLLMPRA